MIAFVLKNHSPMNFENNGDCHTKQSKQFEITDNNSTWRLYILNKWGILSHF